MVSTSKILTVSYGTFSCTLEGFDDSFDTMKAIAEYFRDLASDDRYFGAEPPTPDAEMLAKIAEREVARRVSAHEESGKIHLRADAGTAGATAAVLGAPAIADAEPAAEEIEEPAVMAPAEQPANDAVEIIEAADETLEAAPEEVAETPVEVPAEIPDTVEPEIETAQAEEIAEVEVAAQPEPAPAPTPVAHPDADSVAAKLQRIRAVVSHSEEPGQDTVYSEDEHAEGFLSQTAASIEAALDHDDISADENLEIDPQEDTASILDRVLNTDAPEQSAADEADQQDTAFADTAEQDDEDEDDFGFDIDALARAAAEDAQESVQEATVTDEAQHVDASDADPEILSEEHLKEHVAHEEADDAIDTDELVEIEVEEEDPTGAPVARIIRMKREEFEAAVAAGQLEAADEDDDHETLADMELAAAETDSELSAEEEAELQRELAEVSAEIIGADDTGEDDSDEDDDIASIFAEDEVDEHAKADEIAPSLRKPRKDLADADADQNMTRLMAKTLSEMDEPEGANRRNAIQHLRAAVAATKAEQQAGSDLRDTQDTTEDYRDDLASVVRPRRPHASKSNTTRRPGDARPAPLKLVAEQRVDDDRPAAAPVSPVRPRRVSVSEAAEAPIATTQAGGFADFAEEMGAHSLPDVLEAAAAFMSHVEGREKFSRPQLMDTARQVDGIEFSREDGLRSFGQLLRQGKIQKLKGGRFAVSEQIGFKPDARAVG